MVATARRHAQCYYEYEKLVGGLCSSSSFERVRGNDFVGEIKELERIQRTNGNLPDSIYKVAGWINAGLQPIRYRIMLRKALYYWKLCNKTKDEMSKVCLQEVMEPGSEDQYGLNI